MTDNDIIYGLVLLALSALCAWAQRVSAEVKRNPNRAPHPIAFGLSFPASGVAGVMILGGIATGTYAVMAAALAAGISFGRLIGR